MLLLPGFDEYLLGYKDRSPQLGASQAQKVVPGGNGMLRSTVVQRGRVIGVWRQKLLTKSMPVTVTGFSSLVRSDPSGRRGASRALRHVRREDPRPAVRMNVLDPR